MLPTNQRFNWSKISSCRFRIRRRCAVLHLTRNSLWTRTRRCLLPDRDAIAAEGWQIQVVPGQMYQCRGCGTRAKVVWNLHGYQRSKAAGTQTQGGPRRCSKVNGSKTRFLSNMSHGNAYWGYRVTERFGELKLLSHTNILRVFNLILFATCR